MYNLRSWDERLIASILYCPSITVTYKQIILRRGLLLRNKSLCCRVDECQISHFDWCTESTLVSQVHMANYSNHIPLRQIHSELWFRLEWSIHSCLLLSPFKSKHRICISPFCESSTPSRYLTLSLHPKCASPLDLTFCYNEGECYLSFFFFFTCSRYVHLILSSYNFTLLGGQKWV